MALNPADISVRGQNIGVLEGNRGRVQQAQQFDTQQALAQQQLAEQQRQFDVGLEEARKRAAEAAAQAEQDRWFGIGGSVLGGLTSGGLGIAGRALYPNAKPDDKPVV